MYLSILIHSLSIMPPRNHSIPVASHSLMCRMGGVWVISISVSASQSFCSLSFFSSLPTS